MAAPGNSSLFLSPATPRRKCGELNCRGSCVTSESCDMSQGCDITGGLCTTCIRGATKDWLESNRQGRLCQAEEKKDMWGISGQAFDWWRLVAQDKQLGSIIDLGVLALGWKSMALQWSECYRISAHLQQTDEVGQCCYLCVTDRVLGWTDAEE